MYIELDLVPHPTLFHPLSAYFTRRGGRIWVTQHGCGWAKKKRWVHLMLIDGRHRVGLSIMFGIGTEDEDGGDLEGRGDNFVELPASPGRTEVKKRADGGR